MRTAKLSFGQSAIDCLVLDESSTGLRVSSDAFLALPETLTVELRSGGRWRALRRWQRGFETGLEYVAFAGLNHQAALDAAELQIRLANAGIRDVTARLAAMGHFDFPDLRAAAEAADAAVRTLEQTLRRATSAS